MQDARDSAAFSSNNAQRAGLVLCLLAATYFLGYAAYAILNADVYLTDLARIVRYFIAPGLIGVFLTLAAFLFPASYRLSIATCVLAILAALFAFEALLTVRAISGKYGLVGYMGKEGKIPDYVKNGMPPAYTTRAINQKRGVKELPDALLGSVPFVQVMLCSKEQQPIIYLADRFGFNNPDKIFESQLDIMVLGDSFVEGICLTPGDDIVGQLRQQSSASASFALRGTGPMYQLAVLGRYGQELKPRHTVIAFFEGNDWENLKGEKTDVWLKDILTTETDFGDAIPTQEMLAETATVIDEWWLKSDIGTTELLRRNSIMRNFLALQKTAGQLGIHYPKAAKEQPIYNDIILAAQEMVKEWDGDLSIVYIPVVDRYVGLFNSGFVYNQHSLVRAAADNAGVPFIDLVEIFDSHDNPYSLYAADSHFSKEGAAIAAGAIANHVNKVQSESTNITSSLEED